MGVFRENALTVNSSLTHCAIHSIVIVHVCAVYTRYTCDGVIPRWTVIILLPCEEGLMLFQDFLVLILQILDVSGRCRFTLVIFAFWRGRWGCGSFAHFAYGHQSRVAECASDTSPLIPGGFALWRGRLATFCSGVGVLVGRSDCGGRTQDGLMLFIIITLHARGRRGVIGTPWRGRLATFCSGALGFAQHAFAVYSLAAFMHKGA